MCVGGNNPQLPIPRGLLQFSPVQSGLRDSNRRRKRSKLTLERWQIKAHRDGNNSGKCQRGVAASGLLEVHGYAEIYCIVCRGHRRVGARLKRNHTRIKSKTLGSVTGNIKKKTRSSGLNLNIQPGKA